jgi:hypothetical protein
MLRDRCAHERGPVKSTDGSCRPAAVAAVVRVGTLSDLDAARVGNAPDRAITL